MRSLVEISLKTVDSTQTYAKRHRDAWSNDQLVVISADEQTGGYGRFGRKWLSSKEKNLLVTLVFSTGASHLASLAQVLALCVAEVIGLDILLKWPNDLLLDGKKLGGALCEVDGMWVALGLGLNVNMEDVSAIPQPATSLFLATGKVWDRNALLRQIVSKFSEFLELFEREGFAPFHARCEQRLAYRGQSISLNDGSRRYEGICHSLAPDGRLNLLVTLASGDVTNGELP